MKDRYLDLHDIDPFMRARPIVIIENDGGYKIGRVNWITYEYPTLTIVISTMIGMGHAPEHHRNIWTPIAGSKREDTRWVFQYPQFISQGDTLVFKSIGTKVTISSGGRDVCNFLFLMERYKEKSG